MKHQVRRKPPATGEDRVRRQVYWLTDDADSWPLQAIRPSLGIPVSSQSDLVSKFGQALE